jgi:SAM-dependent methyltransferase
MASQTADVPEFDHMAENYEAELTPWVKITGEQREYFAHARLTWLARSLARRGIQVQRIVDFGCGTGAATPLFFETLGAQSVVGLDVSPRSLAVAERDHGSARARFALLGDYLPDGGADLVFCNGVFHHIPLAERQGSIDYIARCLRSNGILALWENNIWNPIVGYNMRHAHIDEHAVPLTPPIGRRLVRAGQFSVLATDFLFFPRALQPLRRVEPFLRAVPIGGQFLVLAAKKDGAGQAR